MPLWTGQTRPWAGHLAPTCTMIGPHACSSCFAREHAPAYSGLATALELPLLGDVPWLWNGMVCQARFEKTRPCPLLTPLSHHHTITLSQYPNPLSHDHTITSSHSHLSISPCPHHILTAVQLVRAAQSSHVGWGCNDIQKSEPLAWVQLVLDRSQGSLKTKRITFLLVPSSVRDLGLHARTSSRFHTVTLSRHDTARRSHYHTILLSHYHTTALPAHDPMTS